MAENTSPLDQLKSFLNQLFQFDSQDLDFGVYKILHYKRKEIKDFLDNLLVDKVKQQLHVLTAEETAKVKEQLADIERDDIIKGWINGDETTRKILEGINKDKINHYLELKRLSTEVRASVETENHIYNHLSLFFSRYYDKGDFISKRRFGKNEKYVVPYNGEETHFHWANQDQYYVKSSETFQKFAFKVPTQSGNMVVNFKLTAAQVEQGNVKADEANYFILSDKPAEFNDDETSFFFEYRPLTDEEKKNIKGNSKQDSLNEMAYEQIRQETQAKLAALNALWKTDDNGIALLLKKINHYTRKNKYDFFIHKNLKGFLERELDFYIKSELINVDDLYVSEAETHFNRLKHNLKSIKVFKSIADTIIAFVSQIEDSQKKLWEKKKFVLSTEWVITIDRLVEYIGLEAATPILEEVIKNEKQVAEWVELFGDENVPKTLSIDTLKADLHEWRKLPVDTKYYSHTLKSMLISEISVEIELDDQIDGIVIKSDNYQALKLIDHTFSSQIKTVYIDPPYNTEKDRTYGKFLYKDGYSRSSWLSLINEVIKCSKSYLREDGILFCSIDDNENYRLREILNVNYGDQNYLYELIWSLGAGTQAGHFTRSHEYIETYCYDKTKLQNFSSPDSGYVNHGALKKISKANPASKVLFPAGKITIEGNDSSFSGEIGGNEKQIIHGTMEFKNGILLNDVEIEAGWAMKNQLTSWLAGQETYDTKGQKVNRFYFNAKGILWYEKERTKINPATILNKVANTKQGSSELFNLFNTDEFSFPKPSALISYLTKLNTDSNEYVLDFFAGSGTTFHAIQESNRDFAQRKCILIEQGDYFYTVIIPRIKKIAYTFDWKDGKPKNGSMNGLGVFFKYQRLEQYEESLENIAFTAPGEATQMALKVDSYLPKYFLDFETRGSQALVNTTAMQDPWNYTLKVWDGFTYDTEQAVDLVETFNYLIGLHMQKCFTKQINGIKYQFIHGHNNANKKIVVVWRNVKDWTLDDYRADGEALNAELKEVARDLLYINDQANVDNYQPIEEVFKNKMLP
ncbi:MAG TPA: site-specific DNA-methyltransferase [Bacteroidales bacterium]|nr:site-specific DNA-methyltransferase [Bacteroidales bacterium]